MRDTRYNPRGAPPPPIGVAVPIAGCPYADRLDRSGFLSLDSIAPTENYTYRGGVAHGFVHDENAYAMGGVSGHAGLFSTAVDLATFGWRMSALARGRSTYFDAGTARPFLAGPSGVDVADAAGQRLGWIGPELGGPLARPFGSTSFGHTGFTGTSIWIDPELDLVVVLLTNRVHPSRERTGVGELRGAVSAAVLGAIADR
jgi:CubicO group peptidase (beta-lactamase class C family)